MTKEELRKQTLYEPLAHPLWNLNLAFVTAHDAYFEAISDLPELDLLRLYGGTLKRVDRDHERIPLPPNSTPEMEREGALRSHARHLNDEYENRRRVPLYDPLTHPIWNLRVALDTTWDAYKQGISDLSDDDLFLLLNGTLKQIGWDYYELMFAGQRLHGGMPAELEVQLRLFARDLNKERLKRPALLANWELAAFFPDLPQCPGEPQYELDDDGSITQVFTKSDYVPLEALKSLFQKSTDQVPVPMKTKLWTAIIFEESLGIIGAPTREDAESIIREGLEALRMPRSFMRKVKISEKPDSSSSMGALDHRHDDDIGTAESDSDGGCGGMKR